MGLFSLFRPAHTVLVIDTVSLNESLGMKGKVPPRNQLQLLRRLARFSQREKLDMVAVLSGAPLNKAPAGKKFEGISIVYSKSSEDHVKFLVRTANARGAGSVLVSDNSAVEKLRRGAAKNLRVSTFRKAFDSTTDSGGSERSTSGGRGNRASRKNRQKTSNEPKQERPPREMSQADAINELIDLVD
ncbi:MAG TPA: hypothetical protein VLL07_05980 [Pontiella sp.]|nr:hypothetical protein [Pontiella sp.]